MKVLHAFLITILTINYAAAQYSRCQNPNGRAGLCVLINDCQTLYSVLVQQSLSATDKDFIRSSGCGRGKNNRPMVCCTRDTGYTRTNRQTPDYDYDDGYSSVDNEFKWSGTGAATSGNGFFQPWSFNNGNRQASPQRRNPFVVGGQSSFGGGGSGGNIARNFDGSSLLPQPPTCGGVPIVNRIYGGEDTDLNEFPWMVLMEYRRRAGFGLSTSCAGSLINQRYVLTAAHCVTGRIEREIGPLVSVRLGEHDTSTTVDCTARGGCAPEAQRMTIERSIPHDLYKEQSSNQIHDIALVRLERNLRYSENIRPICLPSVVGADQKRPGQQFTVAGWGRTLEQARSPVKQKLTVGYVEPAQCRRKFAERKINIEATQICMGGKYAQDSCDGDSGGPLMRFRDNAWVLEGVVSFGYKCGLKDWPGVYTNIAAYDIWIKQNIRA